MQRKKNEVKIINLSDYKKSEAKEKVGKFNSVKFNSTDEYLKSLSDALDSGYGFVIGSDQPTDKEIEQIKKIYDKYGFVKVFRKKKRELITGSFIIQPSTFKTINGRVDSDSEEIKIKICNYIEEMIQELEN